MQPAPNAQLTRSFAPPSARLAPPAGQLCRVRVRCVAAVGAEEETLLVPIPGSSHWTVTDLLQCVRARVRHVPAKDMQEIELDAVGGGRLHPEDALKDVLKEGDLLLCTIAKGPCDMRLELLQEPIESASCGKTHASGHARSKGHGGNDDLRAGYTRVFGNKDSLEGDDGEESEESPTSPAPGAHSRGDAPASGSRHVPRAAYGLAGGLGLWRNRLPIVANPFANGLGCRDRSRSPASKTLSEVTLPAPVEKQVEKPVLEGREAKWPPLLRAAYEGDLHTTASLLRDGADVNCTMPGAGQKTPIYYAVRFECPDLVRLLLNHPDVDVHRQMRLGRGGSWITPLEAAREAGPTSKVYQVFAEAGLLEAKKTEAQCRTTAYAGVPMSTRRVSGGRWRTRGEPDEKDASASLAGKW